jgi:hypothetical protein
VGFAFFWSAALFRRFLFLVLPRKNKQNNVKPKQKKAAEKRRTPKKAKPGGWAKPVPYCTLSVAREKNDGVALVFAAAYVLTNRGAPVM